MRTTALHALDQKVRGWEWVASEVRRVREACRAEADRLLGPERGE